MGVGCDESDRLGGPAPLRLLEPGKVSVNPDAERVDRGVDARGNVVAGAAADVNRSAIGGKGKRRSGRRLQPLEGLHVPGFVEVFPTPPLR